MTRSTTDDLIRALTTNLARMAESRPKASPEALAFTKRGIASLKDSLYCFAPEWPNDRELVAMIGRIRSPEGSPAEVAFLVNKLRGVIDNAVTDAGIKPHRCLWAEAIDLG